MSALFSADSIAYQAGRRDLVEDTRLALHPGELTIIIGPNGAGKSTLLKMLCGELKPSRGTVYSLGEPLAALPAWRLACRRSVMAQHGSLAFPFRVHEVVRLGSEGIATRNASAGDDERIEDALHSADVLHLAGRNFQTLSGGEQQRVHFARALCQLKAGAPYEANQMLFLDEPIASLDLNHQIALVSKVRALTREGKIGVLAVLHDLNLAMSFADRLVIMNRGRIVAAGKPDEVLDRAVVREVFGIDLGAEASAMAGIPLMILPQFCSLVAQPV